MRAVLFAVALAAGCGGGGRPSAAPVRSTAPVAAVPDAAAPPAAAAALDALTGPVARVRNDAPAGSVRRAVDAVLADMIGKPLDADALRAALAQLMATAGIAAVDVEATERADGVEVNVHVTMQPLMRKLVARETGGAPIALGTTPIVENTLLAPLRMQALVRSLRDRYLAAGHLAATVQWRRVPAPGGAVDAVIEVTPGPLATISSVAFHGASVPSAVLTGLVARWLLPGEPLVEDAIGRASLELQNFYWDRGHASVTVTSPEAVAGPNALVFQIDEGPKFHIGSVALSGSLAPKLHARYLALFGVKPKDLFQRSAIADGRQRLLHAYIKETGSPTADVFPLIKLDAAKQTLDLTLEFTTNR